MIWRHVNRKTAAIFLLISTATCFLSIPLISSIEKKDIHIQNNFQLGLYDLALQHNELYNVEIKTTNNSLSVSIYSSKSSELICKSTYSQINTIGGKVFFYVNPIFNNKDKSNAMLRELIDAPENINTNMSLIEFQKQQLLIGLNGSVYISEMN